MPGGRVTFYVGPQTLERWRQERETRLSELGMRSSEELDQMIADFQGASFSRKLLANIFDGSGFETKRTRADLAREVLARRSAESGK